VLPIKKFLSYVLKSNPTYFKKRKKKEEEERKEKKTYDL
jgi:hypothetical protein